MQINRRYIRFAALLIAMAFTLTTAVSHLQADSSAGNALGVPSPLNTAGSSGPFTAASTLQDSVASVTVIRIGSDLQISWTTTGDVKKVKIKEGTSPEQIDNEVAEVSGITTMTVTGLDPNQRHYFRVKGGSGDGVIAAERGVPQIAVL